MSREGLCIDMALAPGEILSLEYTTNAEKVEICYIPDPPGVEIRVQPTSSGFLCGDRIRIFSPCRQS